MKLIDSPVTWVVPSTIEATIAGAIYAHVFPSGWVRVYFTHKPIDGAYLTMEQLTEHRESFIGLVGAVEQAIERSKGKITP
jgi:hypothetical protein